MKKLIFFALASTLCMYSCKEEDNATNENSAVMIVEKSDTSFTITNFNNTLTLNVVDQYGTTSELSRRLDLRANVDGGQLILSVSNWDIKNPPENGIITKTYDAYLEGPNIDCDTSTSVHLCDIALGTYTIWTQGLLYFSEPDDENGDESYITISENDTEKKTVSGSFDVHVSDFDEDEISFKGTFSNLPYAVN